MTPDPSTTLANSQPEELVEDIGVQRRAPFGENPVVGVRGTRTQQRILLAALELFDQVGYHACRVESITAAAGCSRPTFYQYFSSKDDLFRQLAGVVAREQFRIVDQMGDITPDAQGWQHLRGWLDAHAHVYETYRPVYTAFAEAASFDALVVSGASRVSDRMVRTLRRRIDPTAFDVFPPAALDLLLWNGVNRTVRHRQTLLAIAPQLAPDRERLLDGLTEVLHRAMFGRRRAGMVEHRPATRRRRVPRPSSAAPARSPQLGPAGRATYGRLLDAATATFTTLGYHDARVDDIAAAAGTSHGTFYRYFENKGAVFRAVAARVGQRLFEVLMRIPDVSEAPRSVSSTRRLRSWIAEYRATWWAEGAIVRLWMEELGTDEQLGATTARAFDLGVQRLTEFLAHRDFGDLDVDGLLLISMLDLNPFGPEPVAADIDDLLLQLVRRGFLGIDTRT